MLRLAFVPCLLLACGLADAAERAAESAAVSYLNAEYQGQFAEPGMRPAAFPASSAWAAEGSFGPGLVGPHCEAGYWHDLYPTHCHRAHTMWLWDEYCTSSWHSFGGGCHGCGGGGCDDCSAAPAEHEHVEVAPAVVNPAQDAPPSEEPAPEQSQAPEAAADEFEAPGAEPEVRVPPTDTNDQAVSFPDSTSAANESTANDQEARDADEAPRPDFVPVRRADEASPALEVFEGLDE